MNIEKLNKHVELSNTNTMYLDSLNNSNFIINAVAENKEEFEFLLNLKNTIKKELIAELDKQMENFKYFTRVV